MLPDRLAASLSPDAISDNQLRHSERRVRLDTNSKPQFVPAFPLSIMQKIVEADAVAVLPLVMAIHRQLTMTQRDETPLNETIWKAAGSPSSKKRETILRKLKSLQDVIEVLTARTSSTHYRVRKGWLWSKAL